MSHAATTDSTLLVAGRPHYVAGQVQSVCSSLQTFLHCMLDVLQRVACGRNHSHGRCDEEDTLMRCISVVCIQLECNKAFVETMRQELLRHVTQTAHQITVVASATPDQCVDDSVVSDIIMSRLKDLFADVSYAFMAGENHCHSLPSTLQLRFLKASALVKEVNDICQIIQHQLHSALDVIQRLARLSKSDRSALVCVCVQLECNKEFVDGKRKRLLRYISEEAGSGDTVSQHVAENISSALVASLRHLFSDVAGVLHHSDRALLPKSE